MADNDFSAQFEKISDRAKTATDADMADAYAFDAIDFAQAAVEEAESTALDAMYLRASADALCS